AATSLGTWVWLSRAWILLISASRLGSGEICVKAARLKVKSASVRNRKFRIVTPVQFIVGTTDGCQPPRTASRVRYAIVTVGPRIPQSGISTGRRPNRRFPAWLMLILYVRFGRMHTNSTA